MHRSLLSITALASVCASVTAAAGPCADRLSALSKQVAEAAAPASSVGSNGTATSWSRANEWKFDTSVRPVSSGLPSGGTATQRERAFEHLVLSPEPLAGASETFKPGAALTATQWERAHEAPKSDADVRQAALSELDRAEALDAANNPGCASAIERYEQIRRVR